jgi:L-ribulose-5-phosphate 3-epimerase
MSQKQPLRFGIMQGRLSPPEDGRFQSFPRERWRQEFPLARAAGLDYIEWIYDEYGATANPLTTEAGIDELNELKQSYGIATPALCGDWFMDFPFLRCNEDERRQRQRFLNALLRTAGKIGARRMVLPFVDISRIETETEKDIVLSVLNEALPTAEETGVELHLETDLNPADFAAYLARIPHPMVKVNYDTGNSSGLGYVASEEFAAYGNRIGSIHIKDRYSKPEGGIETRPLGQGSANFDDVFAAIRSIHYTGGLTLQVARGKPGDEVNFIRQQLAFLQRFLT